MKQSYDWNGNYPKPGDKVVRLPGHADDAFMKEGKVYTVSRCQSGSIKFEGNYCAWEPNYFAPAVSEVKVENYQIY